MSRFERDIGRVDFIPDKSLWVDCLVEEERSGDIPLPSLIRSMSLSSLKALGQMCTGWYEKVENWDLRDFKSLFGLN